MIYLQNQDTLEIHRLDDGGRSLEACNIDQIEATDRIELEEADALRVVAGNLERRCGHCWPVGDGERASEV